jgi:hypothetical protein
MSSFAPYVSRGYFDVPICNQYSNQNPASNLIQSTKYNVNNKIFTNVNNNNDSYELDPNEPSLLQPSASLYTESDTQTSGYYTNMTHQPHGRQQPTQYSRQIVDQSDFADDNKPILRKKEMQPYMEEGFHGGGQGGGSHGGQGGGHSGGGYGYGGGGGRHHQSGGGLSHSGYYPNPSNLILGSYFPLNGGGYLDTVSNGMDYDNNIYPVYVEEPPIMMQQPIRQYIPPQVQSQIQNQSPPEKQVIYIENVKDEDTGKPKKKKVKQVKMGKDNSDEKFGDKKNKPIGNVSNRTLWLIIIILSIIILALILYRMYEKKLIKF